VTQAGFAVGDMTVTYGFPGALAYEITKSLDYFSFGRLQPVVFWTYYALVHPWVLLLMLMDYARANRSGNGVMMLAKRA
jgi:hypothetical protein